MTTLEGLNVAILVEDGFEEVELAVDQEAYELLGGRDVLTVPENRGASERGLDGETLP
jgi:hypothetical protein